MSETPSGLYKDFAMKMLTPLENGSIIRVLDQKVGSVNEFAAVKSTSGRGVWIANMNMPFQGTISDIIPWSELTRRIEKV